MIFGGIALGLHGKHSTTLRMLGYRCKTPQDFLNGFQISFVQECPVEFSSGFLRVLKNVHAAGHWKGLGTQWTGDGIVPTCAVRQLKLWFNEVQVKSWLKNIS